MPASPLGHTLLFLQRYVCKVAGISIAAATWLREVPADLAGTVTSHSRVDGARRHSCWSLHMCAAGSRANTWWRGVRRLGSRFGSPSGPASRGLAAPREAFLPLAYQRRSEKVGGYKCTWIGNSAVRLKATITNTQPTSSNLRHVTPPITAAEKELRACVDKALELQTHQSRQ